jgi:hypothetical protein
MTLFNVRLGAWMPNPAIASEADQAKSRPTNALRALLSEAFGQTNDRSDNVYLSDGGHFDNLGIYEMIRRRCRYIIVVDADADKDFAFADLGKAVRQVVIDLEADIHFETIRLVSRATATDELPTCAIARISYRNPNSQGWLIYLKPTYFYETAPVDIRAYGATNPDVPHESTVDQWFSESQFESYRRLGHYMTHRLDGGGVAYKDLAAFFKTVTGH